MIYRAFVKQQLMGGKMHRSRGFELVNGLGLHNRISRNYRSGGTISSTPIVDSVIENLENLRLKSGGRIRKIYDDEKIGKGKKFNSLKFNF
jgi:hypothetical protein